MDITTAEAKYRSYTKKIEKLQLAQHDATQIFNSHVKRARSKELRLAKADRNRFMLERLAPMRPAVIRRRPFINKCTWRHKYNKKHRLALKQQEKKRALAVKRKPPRGTSLTDCLSLPELAEIVLQHFGPYELHILSRVSTQMRITVTCVFVRIAPFYLNRYIEGGNRAIAQYDTKIASTMALISEYSTQSTGTFPLGRFLHLFSSIFLLHRAYVFEYNYNHTDKWLDYCFVRNFPGPEFVPDVPLRDCRVYTTNYYKAVRDVTYGRWEETNAPFGRKEMSKRASDHFNYDEWNALGLQPLHYEELINPKKTVFFDNANHLHRLGSRTRGKTLFCARPTHRVTHITPLFDSYEVRFYVSQDGVRERLVPNTVSMTRDNIREVFASYQ